MAQQILFTCCMHVVHSVGVLCVCDTRARAHTHTHTHTHTGFRDGKLILTGYPPLPYLLLPPPRTPAGSIVDKLASEGAGDAPGGAADTHSFLLEVLFSFHLQSSNKFPISVLVYLSVYSLALSGSLSLSLSLV